MCFRVSVRVGGEGEAKLPPHPVFSGSFSSHPPALGGFTSKTLLNPDNRGRLGAQPPRVGGEGEHQPVQGQAFVSSWVGGEGEAANQGCFCPRKTLFFRGPRIRF